MDRIKEIDEKIKKTSKILNKLTKEKREIEDLRTKNRIKPYQDNLDWTKDYKIVVDMICDYSTYQFLYQLSLVDQLP